MQLKIKILKFLAGKPVCMIHEKTAEEMSLHVGHRVSVKKGSKKIISIVDTVSGLIKPDEIAVSNEIVKYLGLRNGNNVEVQIMPKPNSLNFIKKKMKGGALKKDEITEIVNDIANNVLTDAEIAFFISAVYKNKTSLRETKDLVQAMVNTGSRIRLRGKVADKHCIGGIAGNRTTPLVVSICASAGMMMPKTSSRAITSAAGTADTIETIARVDFSIKEIKTILRKTNACFVWGGALGLAPVDDKIIRVGGILKLDPTAQLLASILSKKISVDSEYILIDIPYGKSAKVTKRQAEKLKIKFLHLGKKFNLKIKVVLTDGSQPIGNGVGPALEMIDIIKILKRDNDAPRDLEKKSIMLSGKLLEMTGKAGKGQGEKLAIEILNSGRAFKKFKQIINVQKGKIKKLTPGKYYYHVRSKRKKRITHLDNKLINSLARYAGCPEDKYAGVYIHRKVGQNVLKKEEILTIYATSKEKLKQARKFYKKNKKEIVKFS